MKQVDWDQWRRDYATTTFADHAAFYDDVALEYPEQTHWNLPPIRVALEGIKTVVEVGGWRGELADAIFDRYPGQITSWRNYDMCAWALEHTRCFDRAYEPILLHDWPWNVDLAVADMFISTHTFEHMTVADIDSLLPQLRKYRRVFIEAPIPQSTEDVDWAGFVGTHILEIGWDRLRPMIEDQGFLCVLEYENSRGFDRI